MTQHFLFVAILITLTHLISLEEIVAIVTEPALLGGFLASSIGIIWKNKKQKTTSPSQSFRPKGTHLALLTKLAALCLAKKGDSD